MSKDKKIGCPDCDGLELELFSNMLFEVEGDIGNGKCNHCEGTGEYEGLEHIGVPLAEAISGEEWDYTCKVCSGTKQCQTCGGTGIVYVNDVGDFQSLDDEDVIEDSDHLNSNENNYADNDDNSYTSSYTDESNHSESSSSSGYGSFIIVMIVLGTLTWLAIEFWPFKQKEPNYTNSTNAVSNDTMQVPIEKEPSTPEKVENFYPNGQSREVYYLADGSIDGNYKYYHDNGQLWTERIYKKGLLVSVLSNFDNTGVEMFKGTVQGGNGYLYIYDQFGNINQIQKYKSGEIELTIIEAQAIVENRAKYDPTYLSFDLNIEEQESNRTFNFPKSNSNQTNLGNNPNDLQAAITNAYNHSSLTNSVEDISLVTNQNGNYHGTFNNVSIGINSDATITGFVNGDIKVDINADLTLDGNCQGSVTLFPNSDFEINGDIHGDVRLEPNSSLIISGVIYGEIIKGPNAEIIYR